MEALSGGGVCLIRDGDKWWGLQGGQAGVCSEAHAFPVSVPNVGVGRDAGTRVRAEHALSIFIPCPINSLSMGKVCPNLPLPRFLTDAFLEG